MIDLTGRVALVTGGSRGIGWACVEALSRAGAACALTYRETEETALDAVRQIRDLGGVCEAVRMDLRSEQDVRDGVAAVVDLMGRIDLLVNNAGVWNAKGVGTAEITDQEIVDLLQVNLVGAMRVTRDVVKDMTTRRFGRIVTIGSTAGIRGEAGHAHYAASKGALRAWTRSLAVELGPLGLTANLVSPGWVFTDMTREALSPAVLKQLESTIPTGRITRPDEVAGAVLFLCSSMADQVNGAEIDVNGGAVFS